MGLESFEKYESFPLPEVVNDSVAPLEDRTLKEAQFPFEGRVTLEEFLNRSENIEFLTDLEMTENIAGYLESVDKLKYDKWCLLSLEQKAELLNELEQNIAAIEHRPALRVELEDMESRSFGYQDEYNHKIVLNSRLVGVNSAAMHREVIDTIVHEGRHAYQHYNVDVKMIHESSSEVKTWEQNFYNPEYQYYRSGTQRIYIPYNDGTIHDVDFRLYYYQPVEIDARNFAGDVLTRLEEDGFVTSKQNQQNYQPS